MFTIPAGDVETPGVPPVGSPEEYNTIFGPEWGTTLNIYGTLTYDWMWAPVQNYWPNGRTMINMYNGYSVSCVGARRAMAALAWGSATLGGGLRADSL